MFAALGLMLVAPAVFAHDPSKSYLSVTLDGNQLTGQWDIPLRDLQTVVPLDLDTNGLVTWEKLHDRFGAITAYACARLQISIDGQPGSIHVTNDEPAVEEFADGAYVEIPFIVQNVSSSNGPSPKRIELTYQLFFDINSLHRGLLRLEANGKTQSAVFTPDHRMQTFDLAAASPGFGNSLAFLREGMWHIWTGYDHILFLLALLLPTVLQREAGQWRSVPALRPHFS